MYWLFHVWTNILVGLSELEVCKAQVPCKFLVTGMNYRLWLLIVGVMARTSAGMVCECFMYYNLPLVSMGSKIDQYFCSSRNPDSRQCPGNSFTWYIRICIAIQQEHCVEICSRHRILEVSRACVLQLIVYTQSNARLWIMLHIPAGGYIHPLKPLVDLLLVAKLE